MSSPRWGRRCSTWASRSNEEGPRDCIIKDVTFRPPPEPTVFMLDDDGMILGTEVLPGEHQRYKDMDNVMFLCQDFVVFTDKKQVSREHWMMPPVSFPESDDDQRSDRGGLLQPIAPERHSHQDELQPGGRPQAGLDPGGVQLQVRPQSRDPP